MVPYLSVLMAKHTISINIAFHFCIPAPVGNLSRTVTHALKANFGVLRLNHIPFAQDTFGLIDLICSQVCLVTNFGL